MDFARWHHFTVKPFWYAIRSTKSRLRTLSMRQIVNSSKYSYSNKQATTSVAIIRTMKMVVMWFGFLFPAILWFAIAFYEASAHFIYGFVVRSAYLMAADFHDSMEYKPFSLMSASNIIWCMSLSINNDSIDSFFLFASNQNLSYYIKHVVFMFIQSNKICGSNKSIFIW